MEPETRLLLRWEAGPDPAGFGLDHPYVDWAWLPILGPGCTAVLRRLAGLQLAYPTSTEVGAGEFARQLGLGSASGPSPAFWRALGRLDDFGLVDWDADASTLTVPRRVPAVSGRLLDRLPRTSRAAHHALTELRPPLLRRPAPPSTPTTGLGR